MADKDREAELTARLAVLEERLAELEDREQAAKGRGDPFGRDAMESIDALFMELLPAEARAHLRTARKERLLAVRSVIDSWIERVDREPSKRRRKESIRLEGD
ncbi:MAG: hypothetical protein MUE82_12455 [Chloroflexi bacterium]|jgi:hypothetical protein|nr:hypothetical protein [Chloroflexota bacterium]